MKRFGVIYDEYKHNLSWSDTRGIVFRVTVQFIDMGADFSGETAQHIKILYHYKGELVDVEPSLTTTRCHFGGKRYWFKCPMCDKRVGILFFSFGYFACRHCQDITYHSKNINRRSWLFPHHRASEINRIILCLSEKRLLYQGRPTRHLRKMNKLINSGYQADPNEIQYKLLAKLTQSHD